MAAAAPMTRSLWLLSSWTTLQCFIWKRSQSSSRSSASSERRASRGKVGSFRLYKWVNLWDRFDDTGCTKCLIQVWSCQLKRYSAECNFDLFEFCASVQTEVLVLYLSILFYVTVYLHSITCQGDTVLLTCYYLTAVVTNMDFKNKTYDKVKCIDP